MNEKASTCMLFQSLAPAGQQVVARSRRAWHVASRQMRQYSTNITIQMSENIGARILVVYDLGTTCKYQCHVVLSAYFYFK